MSHPKRIESADILREAMDALETGNESKVSLRGIAMRLGVKAPSLYRYFPDKAALERALVQEGMRLLMESLSRCRTGDPEMQFRRVAKNYLTFARQRPALYACIMEDATGTGYSSPAGKAIWNLLLAVIGPLSGNPDDTSHAVACWAFLHGFAVLERSNSFGKSGPKHGLETGLGALLLGFNQTRKAGSEPL